MKNDLGCTVPETANLEPWARHGVLLLNTALTLQAGKPNSHGREPARFTHAVLEMLAGAYGPIFPDLTIGSVVIAHRASDRHNRNKRRSLPGDMD
jgi:hypothetical protein